MSTDKKELIKSLIQDMPIDLYSNEKLKEEFSQKWKEKSIKILGKDFVSTYFTKIISISDLENVAKGGQVPSCNCYTGDDYCIGHICVSGGCNGPSEKGCGWLWLDPCNGACTGVIPPES